MPDDIFPDAWAGPWLVYLIVAVNLFAIARVATLDSESETDDVGR